MVSFKLIRLLISRYDQVYLGRTHRVYSSGSLIRPSGRFGR